MKFIFLILYPIVFIIVTFSYQGIDLWLGGEFADKSFRILQILAIGILFNGIAYIPFNFFQGVGKPNIPALINLIELPFYLLIMWISIKRWGINGAAYIWLFRIIIDTTILFLFAYKQFDIKFNSKIDVILFLSMITLLIFPFYFVDIYFKIFFTIGFILIFAIVAWKYLLSSKEKSFLISKIG